MAVITIAGSAPAAPAAITGPSGACRGQSGIVFSVAPVPGATSYQWTLPSGVSGSSTSSSITLSFSSSYSGGNLCVKAINSCGSSNYTCATLSRFYFSSFDTGAISGTATTCSAGSVTYSIAPVTNATSYVWTVSGTGLSIASGREQHR